MPSTFLLQFEESVEEQDGEEALSIQCGTGTGTKAREEPDQDFATLATQTATDQRKEVPDQDYDNSTYFSIPR